MLKKKNGRDPWQSWNVTPQRPKLTFSRALPEADDLWKLIINPRFSERRDDCTK